MLLALSIRNFVLVTSLDLEPCVGFTALTGETGAGKSIVLDALGCALGGKAEKRFVRAGAEAASVSAEFSVPSQHPVWEMLTRAGLQDGAGETLTLRRLIPARGPSRAFLNDQPVSAALLAEIGETLVEIHGQHAASGLTRPSKHRSLLDTFAGNETLLTNCAQAWELLLSAKAHRAALEAEAEAVLENRAWLEAAVEMLDKLAPEEGEAQKLADQRTFLVQTERISGSVAEAEKSLSKADAETALVQAARAIERVRMTPGLETADDALAKTAAQAGDALERALIELSEAIGAIRELSRSVAGDTSALDRVEGRLFALRAEARKHNVQVDDLPKTHKRLANSLSGMNASKAELTKAREKEKTASAQWRSAANALTTARRAAASRLEKAAMKELKPLKLGSVKVQVVVTELPEKGQGASGVDWVEFEVETNPGSGFGPLRVIASGGELARFSLALKCALSSETGATTLIFDEVDQGVGGAVAAAIGERLSWLSKKRAQILAITHSPQVAAAASDQWLVEKSQPRSRKLGHTVIAALNATARREEIARMLSGASVTKEARAAAKRLLAGP